MQFNTDLFYVGGTKQPVFGKQQHIPATAEWQLWFSEICEETKMPLVVDYSFPTKPTKKQIRKLRRQFRKENQNSLAEFFAEEGTAAMYW